MTRTSIELREIATKENDNLNTLIKASIILEQKDQKISLLIQHLNKMVESAGYIFDSDESFYSVEHLDEIIAAIEYLEIVAPEIAKDHKRTRERMWEKINDLPY